MFSNISNSYNFAQMLVYSIGTPLGFALVLFIFSTIRERLEQSEVPNAFVGNPIALIVAAIMLWHSLVLQELYNEIFIGNIVFGALVAIYIVLYLMNKKHPTRGV